MADFLVSDESDAAPKARKRKRAASKPQPRKKAASSSPPAKNEELIDFDIDMDDAVTSNATCKRWRFDPDSTETSEVCAVKAPPSSRAAVKGRPHEKEPEQRYSWIANLVDINKNPPGHPDYDPSSIYIPPGA